jgi:phytoene dehydrogenase-like protein
VRHVETRTPADLEAEIGMTQGNIFHGELTLDQLLFNRPLPELSRYRTPVRGYYLCGSSMHPGGGVMGAPGAVAAAQVLRDAGVRPRRRP